MLASYIELMDFLLGHVYFQYEGRIPTTLLDHWSLAVIKLFCEIYEMVVVENDIDHAFLHDTHQITIIQLSFLYSLC